MRAVGAEIGASSDGQRVGAGLRLGQAIRRDHLRRSQLRQIALLLLFGPEQQQRQRADARVRAVPCRSTTRLCRDASATIIIDVRSISMPPYFSGTIDARQAQFA